MSRNDGGHLLTSCFHASWQGGLHAAWTRLELQSSFATAIVSKLLQTCSSARNSRLLIGNPQNPPHNEQAVVLEGDVHCRLRRLGLVALAGHRLRRRLPKGFPVECCVLLIQSDAETTSLKSVPPMCPVTISIWESVSAEQTPSRRLPRRVGRQSAARRPATAMR